MALVQLKVFSSSHSWVNSITKNYCYYIHVFQAYYLYPLALPFTPINTLYIDVSRILVALYIHTPADLLLERRFASSYTAPIRDAAVQINENPLEGGGQAMKYAHILSTAIKLVGRFPGITSDPGILIGFSLCIIYSTERKIYVSPGRSRNNMKRLLVRCSQIS
jgi:hypothetical protein